MAFPVRLGKQCRINSILTLLLKRLASAGNTQLTFMFQKAKSLAGSEMPQMYERWLIVSRKHHSRLESTLPAVLTAPTLRASSPTPCVQVEELTIQTQWSESSRVIRLAPLPKTGIAFTPLLMVSTAGLYRTLGVLNGASQVTPEWRWWKD